MSPLRRDKSAVRSFFQTMLDQPQCSFHPSAFELQANIESLAQLYKQHSLQLQQSQSHLCHQHRSMMLLWPSFPSSDSRTLASASVCICLLMHWNYVDHYYCYCSDYSRYRCHKSSTDHLYRHVRREPSTYLCLRNRRLRYYYQ